MDYAGSPFEIKQLSEGGSIEGLLAGFGNADSHGDVIDAKAFGRTLAERGDNPLPMLLHHDLKRPVGAWREFRQTGDGLFVKGELTLSTRDAQEAHALAKAGALRGLSIGYTTRRAHTDQRTGERHLLDLDLIEGSLVTVPSNPKTFVAAVKSIGCARDIAEMLQEGGLSGRRAKLAAGAAWKAINDTDADDDKVRAILNASAARIAAIGVSDEMNALTKDFTDAVEKQFDALSADVKKAVTEAGTVKAIVEELEQKLARPHGYDGPETKSWGEQFIDSDGLKAFADEHTRPARFRMELKATITTGSTSGGPAGPAPYRDGIVNMPQRRMRVRDLLPVVGISTGSVEYPKQTTRTNASAMVAEGNAKPESALGWTMQTVNPKVIAHWVPASRQILEDAPMLRDTIDNELLYGLAYTEELQLLNGSGTGENLNGLVTNATAYAAPIDPAGTETMLDQLALAILQNALAEEPADGIIIHPSDWMRMRLLKDADGKYILGDPAATVQPVLFGLPVVATQAMAIDKFLVGNFRRAATLYDRWSPRVEVSTEHDDFFTRNLVAILAEERIALAVKNAAALTFGDFGNVA